MKSNYPVVDRLEYKTSALPNIDMSKQVIVNWLNKI